MALAVKTSKNNVLSIFDETLVLDTSAYADGDSFCDLVTLTQALKDTTATLQDIVVRDFDDQGQALDILFFSQSVTPTTKNSAYAVSDSDLEHYIGTISIGTSDYTDVGGANLATVTNKPITLYSTEDDGDIFVHIISRGTGTYTASGVSIKFGLLVDL